MFKTKICLILYNKHKVALGNESSSSDSSDTEDELITFQEDKINIKNYVSTVVPLYTDDDFQSHFRLNRTTVQSLLNELYENKLIVIKKGRPEFDLKSSLLLTLWTLANQESFRGIADRFGMTKGEAYKIFIRMCTNIYASREKYIVWPRHNLSFNTVEKFNRLEGFPNVLGCVDGCHIAIPGKCADDSYYNRKGYHSVILQGICNSELEFINVFVGWPGSSHDARVFTNSPIYQLLSNDENYEYMPRDCHLIGDSAYPLRTFLMVPYRDNGHLLRSERKFNKNLSKKRVFIEQAFGRLKGSFRRLKYLHIYNLTNIKYIVVTCCILHNICIKEGLQQLDIDVVEDEERNQAVMEENYIQDNIARQKRNHIRNAMV